MLHQFLSRFPLFCQFCQLLSSFRSLITLYFAIHQAVCNFCSYTLLSLPHPLLSTNTLWSYSQNKTLQTHNLCQRQFNFYSCTNQELSSILFGFILVHCTSLGTVSVIILEPTMRGFKTTIAPPQYHTQSHTQRLALHSLPTPNLELSLLSSPTSSNHSLSNLLEFSPSNSLTQTASLPTDFTNL